MFDLASCINLVYETQVQARLFHYQTPSYAQHKAFGNFYESFFDITDSIIEALVGRYGRPVIDPSNATITMQNISDVDVNQWASEQEDFYRNVKGSLDPVIDSDVINKIEEAIGVISALKYFLTLA